MNTDTIIKSNCMLGAVCGDICGSIFEWDNINFKLPEQSLMNPDCKFTDDSVMTIAVAAGIKNAIQKVSTNWLNDLSEEEIIFNEIQSSMRQVGTKYRNAGYGGGFYRWLISENPKPYNSWGNGSAMRASYTGWTANSLEEAERLGEISARVTHNHPEGIKGAKVTAGCIFILKNGGDKDAIRKYASKYYDINFKLDEIRESYTFDVSCQGTVPYSIVSFLEAKDFADTISNAISIGGDSDTLAAIAGSIAEAYYPISDKMKKYAVSKLDDYLSALLSECVICLNGKKEE